VFSFYVHVWLVLTMDLDKNVLQHFYSIGITSFEVVEKNTLK